MPSALLAFAAGSLSATTAGPDDDERALDVGAADADQVHRRRAVRLVDLALRRSRARPAPCAASPRRCPRRRRGSRPGWPAISLSAWPVTAVSLRAKRSVVDELDAGLLGERLDVGEPGLAVAVGVAEEAVGLDADLLPVLDDRDRHHRGRLRHAERPGVLARRQVRRRQHQLRRLAFGADVGHRDRDRRRHRADDRRRPCPR